MLYYKIGNGYSVQSELTVIEGNLIGNALPCFTAIFRFWKLEPDKINYRTIQAAPSSAVVAAT